MTVPIAMTNLSIGDIFSFGAGVNECFIVEYVNGSEIGCRRVNPAAVVATGPIERLARASRQVALHVSDEPAAVEEVAVEVEEVNAKTETSEVSGDGDSAAPTGSASTIAAHKPVSVPSKAKKSKKRGKSPSN